MKKGSFDGIYFLRLFAFLNIFMLHVGFFSFYKLPYSAEWAVSFFFIVSGFLNGYKYYKKEMKCNEIIPFTINKMKKIFPLYLLCMFFMVPFSALGNTKIFSPDFNFSLSSFFYNITLTQSWVPDKRVSMAFTGVGWYLSTFLFLIFMTIPIIKMLKKIGIEKRVSRIVVFVFTIMFSFVYIEFVKLFNLNPSVFCYIFPIGRIFEYIIGIILGISILENESKIYSIVKKYNNIFFRIIMTIIEISSIVLLFCGLKKFPGIVYYDNSLLWLPINLLLIILFCFSNGYFKEISCNKIFVYLGTLTPFAYLVHEVINMYVYLIPFAIPKNRYVAMVLFLTFLSSFFYSRIDLKKKEQ